MVELWRVRERVCLLGIDVSFVISCVILNDRALPLDGSNGLGYLLSDQIGHELGGSYLYLVVGVGLVDDSNDRLDSAVFDEALLRLGKVSQQRGQCEQQTEFDIIVRFDVDQAQEVRDETEI